MWKILCVVCTVFVVASCSRQIDAPQPLADPVLKRTVQTDNSGRIIRVSHYNEFELVSFDTLYDPATHAAGMYYVNTYNGKGKRTRSENTIPVLYTGGFYWAWSDHYQDDTIPTVTYRYLRGNQVAQITHIYNAAKQLITDSTYHTPNYGTFTYLTKYTYDMSGRLQSSLDLNDVRDTTAYATYQYTGNSVEMSVLKIDYIAGFRGYGKTVTDYTASGKILSEKKYGGVVPVLSSQIDYTYDAAGHLLKKTTTQAGVATQEELYFINSTTGKPDKMEFYTGGVLGRTTTYYYE